MKKLKLPDIYNRNRIRVVFFFLFVLYNVYNHSVILFFKVEIKLPVTWPSGTYGLYMSTSGCPTDPIGFETGYVTQDTEDRSNSNQWSGGIHMTGDPRYNRDLSIIVGSEVLMNKPLSWLTFLKTFIHFQNLLNTLRSSSSSSCGKN